MNEENFSLTSDEIKQPSPLPEVLGATDLARLLGVSTSELSRLENFGATKRSETRGMWFFKESVSGYIAHLKGKKTENPRDRLFKAKADEAEIRVEKELGTLVEAEKVTAAFTDLITRARRQLEAIPPRVAAQLAETSVPATVSEILRKEIETALETISTDQHKNTK